MNKTSFDIWRNYTFSASPVYEGGFWNVCHACMYTCMYVTAGWIISFGVHEFIRSR
jgi:hypothetical protein